MSMNRKAVLEDTLTEAEAYSVELMGTRHASWHLQEPLSNV